MGPKDSATEEKEEGQEGEMCFAQDTGKAEEEESGEEEYWFENAAPSRLPVVQPPPQVHTSRIINKFEPRVQTQIDGVGKRFEDDLISPGRLPRKTIAATSADGFDDDYE